MFKKTGGVMNDAREMECTKKKKEKFDNCNM